MADMCGRFVNATPPGILADRFSVDEVAVADAALPKRWNIAPTDELYAVTERDQKRKLRTLRWGLIPTWAHDDRDAAKRINARAETLADKPMFRDAFARRRCLVPADGFYEWRTVDGRRQPYFIAAATGELLALAGIWSVWTPPPAQELRLFDDGGEPEPVRSCAIITTAANAAVQPLHERMPVIVPERRWAEWLDHGNGDPARLARLLAPAPDDLLMIRPVSAEVNDARRDGPHLVEPVERPSLPIP